MFWRNRATTNNNKQQQTTTNNNNKQQQTGESLNVNLDLVLFVASM